MTGPLAIKVVYPSANQAIASKDSNFIFGSVGNGDAGLTINGVLTPVWPNGSFMGWLANPPADNPVYDIVARTETDSVRLDTSGEDRSRGQRVLRSAGHDHSDVAGAIRGTSSDLQRTRATPIA